MGMIFLDSYTGYSYSQIGQKYSGGVAGSIFNTITPGAGRNGNSALSFFDGGQTFNILPVPLSSLIMSAAVLTAGNPLGLSTSIFSFGFGSSSSSFVYVQLQFNGLGGFQVATTTNGVFSGGSSVNGLWLTNSYFHLQVRLDWSLSGGNSSFTANVLFNNIPIITNATQTVSNSNYATGIQFYGPNISLAGVTVQYSDFNAINPLDGVFPTGFAGDIYITPEFPSGVGLSTQWTPSGAALNWEAVDEHPPDGDSSFVYASVTGNLDLYQFPPLSSIIAPGSTVYGVQENCFCRKDNSGSRAISNAANVGGVDYFGGVIGIGDTYDYIQNVWSVNPATSGAWGLSDIGGASGAQFGQKVTA